MEDVVDEQLEEMAEEEYKPKWSFSHKHHRISKETPHEAADRHWNKMDMDNKKTLMGAIEKFKEAKEKNDEDLGREAILSLEELGKHAAEMGDSSVNPASYY